MKHTLNSYRGLVKREEFVPYCFGIPYYEALVGNSLIKSLGLNRARVDSGISQKCLVRAIDYSERSLDVILIDYRNPSAPFILTRNDPPEPNVPFTAQYGNVIGVAVSDQGRVVSIRDIEWHCIENWANANFKGPDAY